MIGACIAIGFAAAAASADPVAGLKTALTHHASFDHGLAADFSRGDPAMYAYKTGAERARGGVKAVPGDGVSIVREAGRFGGALQRERKDPLMLFFRTEGVLDYDPASWSGTVSIWLRISPDEDLEPGYCDPVMLIGNDNRKGFIFAEWSADHQPRMFRYAVRPLNEIWNPRGLGWEQIDAAARPMVQVDEAPFSRERWTHVVFTFDRVNAGKKASGRLYLDGRLQGVIKEWDLTFGWDGVNVLLVLGANYIGYMDDLALFDRALMDDEVEALHGLQGGAGALH